MSIARSSIRTPKAHIKLIEYESSIRISRPQTFWSSIARKWEIWTGVTRRNETSLRARRATSEIRSS
jgi:hypothetical protein